MSNPLNRREFLNVMAAGSACGMFGSWASAAQAASTSQQAAQQGKQQLGAGRG